MPLYKDTDIQNLIALVNQDNPSLPMALDETNFIYGRPQDITPALANGHNTRVRITPKGSSPYRGAVDVTYRRIDLGVLFRSVKVEFTRWVNQSTYLNNNEVFAILNKLYGLNMEPTGFNAFSQWYSSHDGQSRILVASPNNYFYVGQLTVTWYRGQQELGIDILTTTDLDGAAWPQGNDFEAYPDRSLQGEFLLSEFDFTEMAITRGWAATSGGNENLSGTSWGEVMQGINAIAGTSFNNGAYNAETNPQGLAGYYATRTTLPNATLPMANKPGFAMAYIFNTDNHPTFKGKIILYYNV